MKTNRISATRTLAIMGGTILSATQAAGAIPAVPKLTVQAPAPQPMTIALNCTRVGARMVC